MTDAELIQSIIDEYGLSADSFIVGIINKWFSLYVSKGDSYIQSLYTRKRVLAYLIFKATKKVDVTIGGDTIKKSQTVANLLRLLELLNDEIKELDPAVNVPFMESSSPTSTLPDALEDWLDRFVVDCWDGKTPICFA